MRWGRAVFSLVCAVLILSAATSAQEPPPAEEGQREARLAESSRLAEQARSLQKAGRPAEAIEVLERVLAIEREVYGKAHEEVAGTLEWLAKLEEARGGFPAATDRRTQVLEIRTELHGAGHFRVVDARVALEELEVRSKLTPDQRKLLDEAEALRGRVGALRQAGKPHQAVAPAQRALEIRVKVLGDAHTKTIETSDELASLFKLLGRYADALPLLERTLKIRAGRFGEGHPLYATNLNMLADLLRFTGDYVRAARLQSRAREILKATLGEDHRLYVISVYNLAAIYGSLGDIPAAGPLYREAQAKGGTAFGEWSPQYATILDGQGLFLQDTGELAAAERLHRTALRIREEVLGEDHTGVASSLNNLAVLYQSMGDLPRAAGLLQRAREIWKKVLGVNHPNYATCLNNIASIRNDLGEYAAAEALYRESLEITKRSLGEEHPFYFYNLNNLALTYSMKREYSRAEPLYREALDLCRARLGDQHLLYASIQGNLARLYQWMGKFAEALPLFQRTLEFRLKVLGETHPDVAGTSSGLAVLHALMGEHGKAAVAGRQMLDTARRVLDATFDVLSERQQLRMTRLLRGSLDGFLTLTDLAEVGATEAYDGALTWKGAIFARQARSRIPREDPEAAKLFSALEATGRRLAKLCLSLPRPDQREKRLQGIQRLREKKEELERNLALASESYREYRAAGELDPAQLQGELPPGTLLVDFLEFSGRIRKDERGTPRWRSESRITAFLVPAEGEIRRVDLGPAAPIRKAVSAWRASVPEGGGEEVGRSLRELLWRPLSKQLGGARTLLVSPDGALNGLPFSALPGEEPGTYLIEEIPVAIAPVPQLLPALLSPASDGEAEESLLLVGDVDYGGPPGVGSDPSPSRSAAGTATGALPRFPRLPATPAEIAAVRNSFTSRFEESPVRLLRRDEATESAFRDGAEKHRWLHLATHGFFAPASLRSALAATGGSWQEEQQVVGYHPGLLSGLTLSGANTTPDPGEDDGILTALEVASLDLSGVELAVLSACETGLGEVAGGEGVMGLQRAFQVAGARTTLTSLWSVPDRATRLLMERFYGNLWEKRMPKLEALREAQLWLMREGGRPESEVSRGLGVDRKTLKASNGRLPPYYWAGWVLSGDWR